MILVYHRLLLLIAVFSILSHNAFAQDDHGHSHGDDDHNTIVLKRLYRTTSNPITFLWTKADTEENLKVYFVTVGNGVTCGAAQMKEAEAAVEGMTNLAHLHIGEPIIPPVVLDLHVDEDDRIAAFPVQFPAGQCTAMFAYQDDGLFMLNTATHSALSVAFEEVVTSGKEPSFTASSVAGSAIGGAIVVSILPLAFILVMVPLGFLRKNKKVVKTVFHFLNAFGCGSLLAVVALHLYPEMLHMTGDAGLPFWQGGSLVLAAICIIAIMHVLADAISHRHGNHAHGHSDEVEVDDENRPDLATKSAGVENKGASTETSSVATEYLRWGTWRDLFDFKSIHPLVWGITIGDAIHNFIDGTIIATGFMACGSATGWTAVGAIIAHELPQELGDISVMLAKGATIGQALFFNIISQSFGILGCGIVLAVGDNLPEGQLGLLLAFGVGTFLFIALTDIMPMLLSAEKAHHFLAIASGMLLGFVAIGLSMLGKDGSCGGHAH